MNGYIMFLCITFLIILKACLINGQVPPRINIPGAVLVSRPPQRAQRIQQPLSDSSPVPPLRLRKPIPNALPVAIPIREEVEESNDGSSVLEDEAAKLTYAALQAVAPQAPSENEPEPSPRPIQFRPERPLPLLRQDVREAPIPARPVLRQNVDNENVPVRHAVPQARRVTPPAPPVRQTVKVQQRPPPAIYSDDDDTRRNRNRKPPVQILRKYRTDNADGSITWGFENEDGTFKEENIGADCVIRGKYGYVDPEGTKREYSYETGNKCDQPEEDNLEELALQQNIPSRPNANVKRPKAPLQA